MFAKSIAKSDGKKVIAKKVIQKKKIETHDWNKWLKKYRKTVCKNDCKKWWQKGDCKKVIHKKRLKQMIETSGLFFPLIVAHTVIAKR